MKHVRFIITNKYLLTGIAFVIWMLFFDRNDMMLQISRIRQINKLERSDALLKKQISDTRQELQLLKNSPVTLEKYAREKYLMKKDNEDLFVIQIDSSLVK